MNNILVQKYGGTSVGSCEKIKRIAENIATCKKNGSRIVVVVSAMGDTTNQLTNKAFQISAQPPSRELDMLLATGEQVSISLLAMAIKSLGEDVISLTGGQCGIITDDNHKKAKITQINTDRIISELDKDKIVIVAGFQGINNSNDITTLGRGGSDTTAVALAASLKSKICEIYTDVDGVYTTDPRKVKSASLIKTISYDEMLELASLGSTVLHPRSVELARKYNVPVSVKSSYTMNKGTLVTEVKNMEKIVVRGLALDQEISKISILEVPDKPGIAYKLFAELSSKNITVDTIIQNVNRNAINDISFTVNSTDLEESIRICENIVTDIGAKNVIYDNNVSKLSVVGAGITSSSEVASLFFKSLYELGINIQMISSSQIKISCIIETEHALKALTYLHDMFHLNKLNE
ncbi:aspartate kinase [Clostridiaceae bacterium M8S5]|nr:aspartate kinase [Clostridiaceae bacterium M8S5]